MMTPELVIVLPWSQQRLKADFDAHLSLDLIKGLPPNS
jgi:hypothetical protein